jgi:hypothetical protein
MPHRRGRRLESTSEDRSGGFRNQRGQRRSTESRDSTLQAKEFRFGRTKKNSWLLGTEIDQELNSGRSEPADDSEFPI